MLDVTATRPDPGPPPVAAPPQAGHHVSFHEVLSALNPLQYLPVVGTIYRTVTGDQIPEAVRRIGSVVVGALVGGPIGVLTSVVAMAAEKISGIDLDKTGQALLAELASGSDKTAKSAPAPTAALPASVALPVSAVLPASAARPASTAQPAAASTGSWVAAFSPALGTADAMNATAGDPSGIAGLSGADMLNTLELSRIRMAQSAYGRATGLAG